MNRRERRACQRRSDVTREEELGRVALQAFLQEFIDTRLRGLASEEVHEIIQRAMDEYEPVLLALDPEERNRQARPLLQGALDRAVAARGVTTT